MPQIWTVYFTVDLRHERRMWRVNLVTWIIIPVLKQVLLSCIYGCVHAHQYHHKYRKLYLLWPQEHASLVDIARTCLLISLSQLLHFIRSGVHHALQMCTTLCIKCCIEITELLEMFNLTILLVLALLICSKIL